MLSCGHSKIWGKLKGRSMLLLLLLFVCLIWHCAWNKKVILLRWEESGHQLVLPVRFLKSICSCGSGTWDDFLFVFRALQSHAHEPENAFICMDSSKGPEFPSLLRISVANFGKPTAFSLPPYAYSETSDSSLQASLISLSCFPAFVPCPTFWVIYSEVVPSLIIYWVVCNFLFNYLPSWGLKF